MLRISTACLIVLGLAGTAFAEPLTPVEDEGAQVIVTDPNAPQVQVVEQESYAEQGRGLQYGASLYVPIWLGGDLSDSNERLADYFGPGVGIAGRIGWEMGGGLSFELGGGISWNPDNYAFGDVSLINAFVNVGARYAILNPSRILPFAQAGVGINIWNICSEDVCSDYNEYTFGFFGGIGGIYEINMNAALELGVNFNLSSALDVTDGAQLGLSPFVGLTLYY